jgi:hypothetical protein
MVNLDIINLSGQIIQQQSILVKNTNQIIDLKGFAQGIYFVKVYNNNEQIFYAKMVK